MNGQERLPLAIAFLLLFPAISGCVEDSVDTSLSLDFSVDSLVGGEVQNLRIASSDRMSVLVPYLVYNPDTGYFQNGTILNFDASYSSHSIQLLVPPSGVKCIFLLSYYDRTEWPLRKTNESWNEWVERDGHLLGAENSIGARLKETNSTFSSLERTNVTTDGVEYQFLDILRPIRDSSTIEQGSLHGAGIVDGLTVFEMMEIIAVDGDFNDLWGPFTEPPQPDYTNALNYFSGQLSSYGYDTQIHN